MNIYSLSNRQDGRAVEVVGRLEPARDTGEEEAPPGLLAELTRSDAFVEANREECERLVSENTRRLIGRDKL